MMRIPHGKAYPAAMGVYNIKLHERCLFGIDLSEEFWGLGFLRGLGFPGNVVKMDLAGDLST
jgi:hypothetical protein